MNLIDRDKLIEEIKKISWKSYSDVANRNLLWLNDAIKVIEKQPTVDRWISCKERLPRESGSYLATIKANGRYYVIECMYHPKWQRWKDVVDNTVMSNVIAWQPLPPKYEG